MYDYIRSRINWHDTLVQRTLTVGGSITVHVDSSFSSAD